MPFRLSDRLGASGTPDGDPEQPGEQPDVLADTTFLAEPEAADLKTIQAWWQGLKGDAPMPVKAQLKPQELKTFLSRIQLIEVIDGGQDYCARVFGLHWVELAGADFTNRLYSEFNHDASRRKWTHFCDLVVRSREPLSLLTRLNHAGRTYIGLEALFLPFADRSGAVGHLLVGLHSGLSHGV